MAMTKKTGSAPSWSFHTESLHTTHFTVFSVLLTRRSEACFIRWVKSFFQEAQAPEENPTDIIPIDGKTIRGSKGKGKRAVHMVSAFRLVLGQKKVDSKTNEITAIPELFEIIDMKGHYSRCDQLPKKSLHPNALKKKLTTFWQ